jgi:serine/threonine protein kinase
LFTGKNTFEADNSFDAKIAVLNFPITPIETYRKDFPPALKAVIERAMKKSPSERYANWDEFLHDFGEAAHAIRMSDGDADLNHGFSMTSRSAVSNHLAADDEYSRSVFSRSVLSNFWGG